MYKKFNFPSTSGYVEYLFKYQGGPIPKLSCRANKPKNILNLRVGVLIFSSFLRFIRFLHPIFFLIFLGLLSFVCLFTVKHIAKDL